MLGSRDAAAKVFGLIIDSRQGANALLKLILDFNEGVTKMYESIEEHLSADVVTTFLLPSSHSTDVSTELFWSNTEVLAADKLMSIDSVDGTVVSLGTTVGELWEDR